MVQEVREHPLESDLDALGVSGQLFPPRSLALNEVLRVLIIKLHLRAHLLEANVQGRLVDLERHAIADVVHLESGAIADGALDAVVAEIALHPRWRSEEHTSELQS